MVLWARRRPAAAALVGVTCAAGLLLIAGLTAGILIIADRQRETQQALDGQRLANEKLAEALRREQRFSYFHHLGLGERYWQVSDFVRLRKVLDECRPEELRSWEWHYLQRQCRPDHLVLDGHKGQVFSVSFRPDGKRLASADEKGVVQVWDVEAEKEAPGLPLLGVFAAYSPDGKLLAVAQWNQERGRGSVRLLDADTGKEVRTLPGGGIRLAFSPDGRHLASFEMGDGNRERLFAGTVRVWEAATGRQVLAVEREECGFCFALGDQWLALGEEGGQVKLYDLADGKVTRILQGRGGPVFGVACSPDGERVAALTGERTAVLTSNGSVAVWDAASGKELLRENNVPASLFQFNGMSFSPDGTHLAVSAGDVIHAWHLPSGQKAAEFRDRSPKRSSFIAVTFSPDGRQLVAGSGDQVHVWDFVLDRESRPLRGHEGMALGVAFSPDGKRLASCGQNHAIKLWDVPTGQEVFTRQDHTGHVFGIAFRPDGRQLASASEDRTVKLWDADTGRVLRTLRGHAGEVYCVSYRPNGKRLASAGSDSLRVWDVETGKLLLTLNDRVGQPGMPPPPRSALAGGRCIAYSPDGRRLASGGQGIDSQVTVWDAQTGQRVASLAGHNSEVVSVAFSPDGKRLASSSEDQDVIVWDVEAGKELVRFRWHTGRVSCVVFSPDGKRLASASHDRTVKLGDPLTGHEVFTLRGHTDLVSCVAFSSDGLRLAAGGGDGSIRVWDAEEWSPNVRAARRAAWGQWAPAWHLQQAEDAWADGRWSAVRFHLERTLSADGADGRFYSRRAELYAALGREDQAAADLAQAVARQIDEPETWRRHALFVVRQGDLDSYRRTCRQLLERFADRTDPETARTVQEALVLAPAALPPGEWPLPGPRDPRTGNLRHAAGGPVLHAAVLYRLGRYREAIARMDETLRAYPPAGADRPNEGTVIDWLFRAMAHQQLGEAAEARRWLDRALARIDQMERDGSLPWPYRLECNLLRREAEGLIQGGKR